MDKVGKLLGSRKYKELESLCLSLLYETKQIVKIGIRSKYFK